MIKLCWQSQLLKFWAVKIDVGLGSRFCWKNVSTKKDGEEIKNKNQEHPN